MVKNYLKTLDFLTNRECDSGPVTSAVLEILTRFLVKEQRRTSKLSRAGDLRCRLKIVKLVMIAKFNYMKMKLITSISARFR